MLPRVPQLVLPRLVAQLFLLLILNLLLIDREQTPVALGSRRIGLPLTKKSLFFCHLLRILAIVCAHGVERENAR